MILVKKIVRAGQDERAFFEIPNESIGWGAIILALVQALGVILGNLVSNVPTKRNDIITNELRKKNFEVQLLQRVLENTDSNDRANSISLLIHLRLLDDPDQRAIVLAQTPEKIPRWEKHPIESINWGTQIDTKNNSLNHPHSPIIDSGKVAPNNN